jgi:thiamine-monophosphate kinase
MSSEADFIKSMRAIATHPGARGLSDDAAVLVFGDEALVLTHDMMVEGVHWLGSESATPADPFDVAWKLVAVNLSDLAAKGAEPLGVLLGFPLGGRAWDVRFAEGLAAALAAFDTPLLGGDTVAGNGARTLGLTAIGRATYNPPPSRSGAQDGDALWLCGAVGEAMAGYYAIIQGDEASERLINAFHRPMPLLAEGQALALHAHAMMDVSDGLLLDAARMAEASDLSVYIESAAVPIGDELAAYLAKDGAVYAAQRLSWGDDYALLFAAPEDFVSPVLAYKIGRFESFTGTRVTLDGQPYDAQTKGGYWHQRPNPK